jgi:hypothetical protein
MCYPIRDLELFRGGGGVGGIIQTSAFMCYLVSIKLEELAMTLTVTECSGKFLARSATSGCNIGSICISY